MSLRQRGSAALQRTRPEDSRPIHADSTHGVESSTISGGSRPTGNPDRVSLVAGLVLVVLGVVLLLDRTDTLQLTFASMAPIAFGAVGAILLASGLSRDG